MALGLFLGTGSPNLTVQAAEVDVVHYDPKEPPLD